MLACIALLRDEAVYEPHFASRIFTIFILVAAPDSPRASRVAALNSKTGLCLSGDTLTQEFLYLREFPASQWVF